MSRLFHASAHRAAKLRASSVVMDAALLRQRKNEDVGASAMVTLWLTTVGHPHDGVVPSTTSVRRTGTKPGAVTSRVYVPAVPGTRQTELHGMVADVAPVTC